MRLNILLAKDTLAKLNRLQKASGLASRGRTIEFMVDAFWRFIPTFMVFDKQVQDGKLNLDSFITIATPIISQLNQHFGIFTEAFKDTGKKG